MKIYKYKLGSTVSLPKDAKILHCNMQNEALHLWALVNSDEKEEEVYDVCIIGTGHSFNFNGWDYISTVIDHSCVWHVWLKKVTNEWEFS